MSSLIHFRTKGFQFCRHLRETHIGAPTNTRSHIQQSKVSICTRKITKNSLIRTTGIFHHERRKFLQQINRDFRMNLSKINTLFVRLFQIQVHHLLFNGSALCRNPLVKQQLVFNFSDRRTFDCRRMGNNRIQIELPIVYLRIYSQFTITGNQGCQVILWHNPDINITILRTGKLFRVLDAADWQPEPHLNMIINKNRIRVSMKSHRERSDSISILSSTPK